MSGVRVLLVVAILLATAWLGFVSKVAHNQQHQHNDDNERNLRHTESTKHSVHQSQEMGPLPLPRPTAQSTPAPPPPTQTPSPDHETHAAEKALAWRRTHVTAVADRVLQVATKTSVARGIVLPLFDGVAPLGISLILQLRAMGVALPIDVPHCGDLSEHWRKQLETHAELLQSVRVYDICVEASTIHYTVPSHADDQHALFCHDLEECHRRFRSYDIKVLALVLSRFDEIMLLDADALFFQDPSFLWDTRKFQSTGTLFFHDRIAGDSYYLALRNWQRHGITVLEEYLSDFDAVPFQHIAVQQRLHKATTTASSSGTNGTATTLTKPHVSYTPSEFLATSHAWQRRSGYQADSSMLLWSKSKQHRATAMLGTFFSQSRIVGRPPGFGDKEMYFLACELSESEYAFSDFATGALGTEIKDDRVMCGDMLHYVPEQLEAEQDNGLIKEPSLLYGNSEFYVITPKPQGEMHRTRARPAAEYPGRMEDRALPAQCPFDVTIEKLTDAEAQRIKNRQDFYSVALSWSATATGSVTPSQSA